VHYSFTKTSKVGTLAGLNLNQSKRK